MEPRQPVNQTPPLPCLNIWRADGRKQMFVAATFAEPFAFNCDAWCYESDDLTFSHAPRGVDATTVQMFHHWNEHDWIVQTTVSAKPQRVDFLAELIPANEHAPATSPDEYPFLNICWQLKRAHDFSSWPEPYPEFIKRCFIFTEQGVTFLDQTERLNIPVRAADDPRNNPPWVQAYLPIWQAPRKANSTDWAAISPTHYTLPVIGVVSRDRQYLAAISTPINDTMCQAWHDCVHNNCRWFAAPTHASKIWRMTIHVMRNRPEELAKMVEKEMVAANVS